MARTIPMLDLDLGRFEHSKPIDQNTHQRLVLAYESISARATWEQQSMEAIWKRVRGELCVSYGHDFEERVLHYLRVIWPNLIKPTSLLKLDRYGVDLCTAEEPLVHSVVVQAKGFRVDEQITDDQKNRQIFPSIRKFLESPLACDTYVLVHNRRGDNERIRIEIEAELKKLVEARKANTVLLWDLSKAVKEVRQNLDQLIRQKLSQRSESLLADHQRMFHFGHLFVDQVPLRQFLWNIERDPPKIEDRPPYLDASPARLIVSPRRARYSILTGSFGVGKSTSVLRAAATKDQAVIYVRAASIDRSEGSQGTNFLMQNVGRAMDLLEELPPDTATELEAACGVALARILRQANDNYVLVVDGLDEHTFYSTAYGLQWLTNELAELRCPIVLTTRTEHFELLSGNFRLAVESLSKKGGARRSIGIMELGSWSETQALDLIEKALSTQTDPRIVKLIRHLGSRLRENSNGGYTSLLAHPLFLQMTLDLIVDGHDAQTHEPDELMNHWMKKKIERDLLSPRIGEMQGFSVDDYVFGMIEAMREIAVDTIQEDSENVNYQDEIPLMPALDIARKLTGVRELDAVTFLSTSLFVPATVKRGEMKKIRFFHRHIQEFLANRDITE